MQRSYKCPCSVRALEAFVRDVAGLDIRQRPNYISFRNLSNRSALQIRHNSSQPLASQSYTTIRSLDDTFVPFDNITDPKLSTTTTQDATSDISQLPQSSHDLDSPEPFDPDEEIGSTVDFEPEVVIHEEHAQTEPDPIVRHARIQQLDLKDRDQAVDAIFFPDLLAQPRLKPGELMSLGQRLNIFSEPTPKQNYPGKNARKKARRAAHASEVQSLPLQNDASSVTLDLVSGTGPATATKSPSKNKVRAEKKARGAPLAPEDRAILLEQNTRSSEPAEDVSADASTTTPKPISQARKDRKARRAAAQAVDTQTDPTQDEEAVDIASLIASATSPKPPSAAKASKIAQAIKTRKEEEKAAKQAAAEKLIADQAAAKLARKERNRNLDTWTVQKNALQEKFGEQNWNPRKRISPDALAGIRALHAKAPETYSTAVLAEHFKVPPEAIRRILKSKWQPNEEEAEDRRERWEKRGEKKWTEMAELGIKPPKKWRERGVGKVGPGEVPPWRQPGKAGERWIESTDADGFVVAGDQHADELAEGRREDEDDGIASRIL